MHFLIPVLVSLMASPVSAAAPVDSYAVSTPAVMASSSEQLPAVKVSLAPMALAPLTTKLTAYNAVPSQTDNNPFVTAIGAFSNPEVVAARSGDLASKLPYGTVIAIERAGADTPSCYYSKVQSQIGYRVHCGRHEPAHHEHDRRASRPGQDCLGRWTPGEPRGVRSGSADM